MNERSRGLTKPRLFLSETRDDLLFGELKLIQKRKGYRCSVDALLISDFALAGIRPGQKIMDLGAGSGVISLILAKRSKAGKIVGVEIQKSLAGMAKRNVRLNRLEPRIKIINHDARHLDQIFPPQSFDLIVSNPPFRKVGAGFPSPNRERALARYELKLKMGDLIKTCSYLLKPKAKAVLVYPFERLWELAGQLQASRLWVTRLKFAFHKKGDPLPILFCVEIGKSRKPLKLEAPWFIETDKGRFHLDRD